MNNTVLTIILLLVMMVVVMTSLNRSSGSSAFGSVSSVLLVLTLIFIIHFLIKNVLKTRGNQVPEENIEAFLGKCKGDLASDEELAKKEDFEMKNDLLEYVQNMGDSRNTETEITMKPPVNVVQANSPSDKLASYGSSGTTDLNSFFSVKQNEACVFKEVPTGSRVQTEMVKAPELVDKVSHETLYLSGRNDNMTGAHTVENTTWKYDNEKVMNGGELFGGVSGYNDMDAGYASVL